MWRMDSINIQTNRYMKLGSKSVICIDLKSDYNTKTHQNTRSEPTFGARTCKNVDFDTPKGYLPHNFFQRNFIYIILGYR